MLEDRFECWSECKEGFVKGISFDNGCGLHCRFFRPCYSQGNRSVRQLSDGVPGNP